jgi:hypothetical protein
MSAPERPESTTGDVWVLQARPTEGSGKWETMDGFAYPDRAELMGVYDKFFRDIEGKGCTYRFMHLHVVETRTYFPPEVA